MLSFFTAAAQGGGTTAFAAATAIAAGVLVGGFAGVRGLWNRVARRERLRLERLADATAAALATPEETAGLEDGDPEPVGRIRR
jgi:hypothetical protein